MMNTSSRNKILSSYMPRLMLLLGAISPATERHEQLFYLCVFLILVSFFACVIGVIMAFRKGHRQITDRVWGTPRDCLDDILIAIAGIFVCYSMDYSKQSIFWWIVLMINVLQLRVFYKKRKE